MAESSSTPVRVRSQHFFFRGLAILLPSVLTIWILFTAYTFVADYIAEPINQGIRALVIQFTPFPPVQPSDLEEQWEALSAAERSRFEGRDGPVFQRFVRREKLGDWWEQTIFADLLGLITAVILIYTAGLFVGSYVGARLYRKGEELLSQVPLIKQVYPAVKQLTEFVFGGNEEKMQKFSRVVAVQYPRMGIWSIGLVTGETLRTIQESASEPCLTVFIPNSPTPFTGFVITVKRRDTVDMPMTVEEALRFTITGGVVAPPSQRSGAIAEAPSPEVLPAAADDRDGVASDPSDGSRGSDEDAAAATDRSASGV